MRGNDKGHEELVRRTERFAADAGRVEHPTAGLKALHGLGLLQAPLPRALGGAGLGTEPSGHLPLLRILASIGGADLPLGRLYEGHVNALILIHAFGTAAQMERAAGDARAGRVFGVWNTGRPEPLRLERNHNGFMYRGGKTFASGAGFVDRPVVTADFEGGWQMTLPRMEAPEVAPCVEIDCSSWQPLGMERSDSFHIEFTGAKITEEDCIGGTGDFYRDPLFRGGAIRFAAVQAGAVQGLHRMFAGWLRQTARGEDPYQLARLGEGAMDSQECALWVEHAAAVAERDLHASADEAARERVVCCANMMRLAVERLALRTMERVTRGVGARGLLVPAGFEQHLRDLAMYLRQPAPDQTLAEVGRAALRGNA